MNLSDAIGLEIEQRENTLPQRLRDMHPRAVNVSEWNTLAAAADYIEALEAERDSLKDSLHRVLRKLPHVDRKILAERHGIKEANHE